MHISDWYTTFLHLARSDNPGDTGPGRFPVDGVNLWPYLSNDTSRAGAGAGTGTEAGGGGDASRQPHANETLVIGFNYSTMLYPVNGGYDRGSGALIEVDTGYKIIVGSQDSCQDCMSWDPRDYPCVTSPPGRDCVPHCLFNVLEDASERHDLAISSNTTSADRAALARLVAAYEAVGKGPVNILDKQWNEQGTPWDPAACANAARRGGYWRPWLPPA